MKEEVEQLGSKKPNAVMYIDMGVAQGYRIDPPTFVRALWTLDNKYLNVTKPSTIPSFDE